MPEEQLEYEPHGKLIIFSIEGLEMNIVPESYGVTEYPEQSYHRLMGEFFYRGLLLDCQLIMSEQRVDTLLQTLKISINKIINGILYFTPLNENQMNKIKNNSFDVKCFGDYNLSDVEDDEENYTFYAADP
jgi:hypothetical protein